MNAPPATADARTTPAPLGTPAIVPAPRPERAPGAATWPGTVEATWHGGPHHGVAMRVLAGEPFFPLYEAGDTTSGAFHAHSPAARSGAWTARHCPVRPGPDGSLVIDWHAGTVHVRG